MTRTFLIAVDLPVVTAEELQLAAGDIEEACLNAGLEVQSVKPWENPTLTQASGYFASPPPQQ